MLRFLRAAAILGVVLVGSVLTSFLDVKAHFTVAGSDVNITPVSDEQREPSISVHPSDSTILVMAAIGKVADLNWVGYSRSTNGGTSWSAFTPLTIPGEYTSSYDPVTAFDGAGNAYIVGIVGPGEDPGTAAVFLAKSTNNGQSFSTNVLQQPNSARDKTWMAIDLSRSPYRIHIIWVDGLNIKTAYTEDGLNLSTEQLLGTGRWPVIAVASNGNVYAAWFHLGCLPDASSCTINFRKSTNRGVSWPGSPLLARTTEAHCIPGLNPNLGLAVDADPATLYIVWHDCRNGHADVWMSKSTDSGAVWQTEVKVNDDGGSRNQFLPAITTKNGEVYVAFYDMRNDPSNADIYFAESDNHGTSFLPNVRVTDAPFPRIGDQGDYMGIAASSSAIHPIWTDGRNNATTLNDIYTDKIVPVNPPPGGSVASGTLITLADGSRVLVQNLRVGEAILLFDVYTHASYAAPLTQIRRVSMDSLLTIHAASGLPLRVDATPGLKFYVLTDHGPVLKSVMDLRPGDMLYNYEMTRWVAVESITVSYGGRHDFYDLLTDPYLTADGNLLSFIANGYADPCQTPCKQGPTGP